MNIALVLEMAAEAAPDRDGLVCDGMCWTYNELLNAARGAADNIKKSGATHITLLDESSEASVIALFGAALAGIPYTPLNYRLADADLGALLDRIAPAFVIGDVARVERLCRDERNVLFTRAGFTSSARTAAGIPPDDRDPGEGVAIELFTSGTTAAPKAAILRHSNLVSYILGTVEFASAREEESALVCVPPYHIAGIAAILSSVYSMRRILLLPSFSPQAWLDLASHEKATNAFVVPTMLSRIIEKMETSATYDLSALKAIAYGGGKMPLQLIERALELMPITDFTNAYGLTETSSTIALLSPDEHRAAQISDDPAEKARLASVGRALPSVEIQIRDEEGHPVRPGERGEIYVRGDQVSGEYQEGSVLDTEGWFPTRDAGWLDDRGYLFLAGRADDVIVRGGENISPGEIEDVLLTHTAIKDACAVAVPSLEWGEVVGVALTVEDGVVRPTENEIKEMIRARLRSSRVPERILFVDVLPYNEMGKLLRRKVKNLFAK